MRTRAWIVGVALFVTGLFAGTFLPSLKAQAASDPCVAPWDVVVGPERVGGGASAVARAGWHAVKWNRCTGEAVVFSTNDHKLDDKQAWLKLSVK
jgi:hypothetical protein